MSATKIGFNFRGTSGYVTDGTDQTYVVQDGYPTTRAGWTFGWNKIINIVDRNNALDPRLAGKMSLAFIDVPAIFRVDLPATGGYRITLAVGDAYGAKTSGFAEVRDNTTPLVTIDHATGLTSGVTFRDAMDVEYSAAAWPGSNTPVTVTFTGTILNMAVGKYDDGGNSQLIAHLGIEQVPVATTTTLRELTLLGVG